jgi:hypothetical protein
MFGDKDSSKANNSFKNHIRHSHHKSGFSRSFKYRSARPLADSNVKRQVNKHVMKGLTGYEQMRNHVMETGESTIQHVNQVTNGIKKAKVSIGL